MNKIPFICGMAAILISSVAFSGCKKDDDDGKTSGNPMSDVPQVKTLVAPQKDLAVDLNTTDNLLFEWAEATCEGDASSTYQLVFTMPGDFARPLMSFTSDAEGVETQITLSKVQLDQIAAAAGAISPNSVTVQWGVYAQPLNSKFKTISTEMRTITITRYNPTPARVATLIAPEDAMTIDLQTVENVEFSWEAPYFTGVGDVKYDLLFIAPDGNLNEPLFEVPSADQGVSASVSLTRSQLDEIAILAGAQTADAQADLKWGVRATSGVNNDVTLSAVTNTISLIRSNSYVNPVYTPDFPDPTAIKADDGYFYAYSTQSRRGNKVQYVPIIRSKDLVNWEEVGGALQQLPDWKTTPGGGVWAPNINYINGKYYLFYSFAALEDTNEGCGLAISDTPGGPFTDCGKLFDVSDIGVENCIDPFYIYDEGIHYLFFGSHQGIYGVEMDADFFANHAGLTQDDITGAVKKDTKFQVVPNGIEATYIYKKNGYYYLFGSNGKT